MADITMQADKLRELRELLAKATPGPWRVYGAEQNCFGPADEIYVAQCFARSGYYAGAKDWQDNAAFIVAAVNALPELLAIAEGAEADRADAEANHRRYQWAANELLACDYGDNDRGEVGWIVYGWRDLRGGMGRRIYGPTIDAAIDAALAGAVTQGGGGENGERNDA